MYAFIMNDHAQDPGNRYLKPVMPDVQPVGSGPLWDGRLALKYDWQRLQEVGFSASSDSGYDFDGTVPFPFDQSVQVSVAFYPHGPISNELSLQLAVGTQYIFILIGI